MVDGIAEAHGDFGRRRVVDRGIKGLQYRHLVHPLREPRRHDGEKLDETGVDAAAEDGRPAPCAGPRDALPSRTQEVAGDEPGRTHDVDSRAEDTDQL